MDLTEKSQGTPADNAVRLLKFFLIYSKSSPIMDFEMIKLYIRYKEEDICAAFQELGPPCFIRQWVSSIRGKEVLCDVTGWNADGQTTSAMAQKITDSGDAQAVLIYGGEWGIILKPQDLHEAWNPDSPLQDHRAYMVVSSDSVLIDPIPVHPQD